MASASDEAATAPARERILEAAYRLFSRFGVRAVAVDRVIVESGVAKKTFYRHFPSKTELALAFLRLRGRRFTHEWLEREMYRRGATARERLLAGFDALDEWFASEGFESCALLATAFETRGGADAVVNAAAVRELEDFRHVLAEVVLAGGAVADPRGLAGDVQLLMLGAIAAATYGDRGAARRARVLAALCLEEHGLR